MTCHKPSYLNSRIFILDFTCDCCRLLGAEKLSQHSSQFKWVTRETRYRVSIAKLLKRNLMSQVVELFGRPSTILKMPYFSGDHQFFQKSPGVKFLYDPDRKRFRLLAGETSFGTGEALPG